MGVSFIRKTIPRPTPPTAVSPGQTFTLVRAMGQRLFENALRSEVEMPPSSMQPVEAEMTLARMPAENESLQRLRENLQNADSGSRQAMITAAYIKAAAMGSGSAAWKAMAPMGSALQHGTSLGLVADNGADSGSGAVVEDGAASSVPEGLGFLSARFESGRAGVDAVGYDPGGGTSYGLYQIASRPGTMARFLDFLADHEPRWAQRLRAAGPANTGSSQGAMPRVWKAIAREDPKRFAALQHAFVRETHYEPARRAIQDATGVDVNTASRAVQEVLWSAAVQHGPGRAADMFIRALSRQGGREVALNESALIQSVYRDRGQVGHLHWGSLRDALLRRFQEEKAMALAMLQGGSDNTTA
ncbi:VgrG-related protein [Desulfosoma caldarium]|uniref:Type VI secretion system spike protein VgrG3-like C-terminal domain-containing protein n=1 Tax=Desulfosoma caldarium TaxID=610254 RepID=A0A3N1UHB9_9BACT|nr:hypothetical protein [Desulfosoma caldarium]ROQ90654.1 hypothetical protein EDC27_2535 [Desulfosoma caldarium]